MNAGLLETVVFKHDGREFQATLMDDGSLKIFVTGRRNGRMLIQPESNVSITISTEKEGIIPSPVVADEKPHEKNPKKVAAGFAPRGPRTQQHSVLFGKAVRAKRGDLTVKEFAKKIGVSVDALLRAEDGWLPNFNCHGSIADKLGIPHHRFEWPDATAKVFTFKL